MIEKQPPDYLLLGHITKDNTPNGSILGGTCSYSALTAYNLGQQVSMVTSAGADIPSLAVLNDIQIKLLPSPQSTTFENIYTGGKRHQKWLSSSKFISFEDIPPEWYQAKIVHLAPVSQEISPTLCGKFPNSLVGVTMQGWLRGQDGQQNVIYKPHPYLANWFSYIDVLIISLSDVFGNNEMLTHFLTSVSLGVETLGKQGCRVYHQGQVIHIPVEPNHEVDPTGAGDIFATAFFIKYAQSGDYIKAAQFANSSASISVTRAGLAGVPTLSQVEAQLAQLYPR